MSFSTGARLSLIGAAAALGAVLVLLLSAGHASGAQPMKMNMNMSTSPALSAKAVKFRLAMNKLWEDHITWTRMVIVDFAANLPDLQTAEARLLRNQADIGNAIKPYYGAAAGNQLTSCCGRTSSRPCRYSRTPGPATTPSSRTTWRSGTRTPTRSRSS
jgi:hypothetical protein